MSRPPWTPDLRRLTTADWETLAAMGHERTEADLLHRLGLTRDGLRSRLTSLESRQSRPLIATGIWGGCPEPTPAGELAITIALQVEDLIDRQQTLLDRMAQRSQPSAADMETLISLAERAQYESLRALNAIRRLLT